MKYFFLFILSISLFSCDTELSTDDSVREEPTHLLSKEVFTDLYYDIQLTEAAVRIEIGKGADSKEISAYLYEELLEKYGITPTDLKENVRYYSSDPQQMSEIQTNVVNRLTKKEAELTNQ
jgi:hypothetical protein